MSLSLSFLCPYPATPSHPTPGLVGGERGLWQARCAVILGKFSDLSQPLLICKMGIKDPRGQAVVKINA